MTEQEMRKHMEMFIDEAFCIGINTAEQAKELRDRFETFCRDNAVPIEISDIFAESGAGEMLWMMQGI